MKNIYKQFKVAYETYDIDTVDLVFFSNGSCFVTFDEQAMMFSKEFSTNLITKPEYTFTVFEQEKMEEILNDKRIHGKKFLIINGPFEVQSK